jgi:peptidyl-tRNA hydrolase
MTTKAAFAPDEWKAVLEGPPAAGMMVIMAARGGTFRETMAMGKAYAEARALHGQSELLDEIVAAKPKADHTMYHSYDELRDNSLRHLRTAVELLERKATAEEVDGYRRFVLAVANKAAAAHRENGVSVSPGAAAAIDQITAALGPTGSEAPRT